MIDAKHIFFSISPTIKYEDTGEELHDAETARRLNAVYAEDGTFLGLSLLFGRANDTELWYFPVVKAPEGAYSLAIDGTPEGWERVGLRLPDARTTGVDSDECV